MWLQKKGNNSGFSIVEMMVVIVIIGLLGTLALSRYYTFIARGRQAEARMNLKTIGDLQESHKYEHEEYHSSGEVGAFNTSNKCGTGTNDSQMKNGLGFRPKDCGELRYGYTWGTASANANSTTNANKRVYPDCESIDEWTVTYDNGNISNGKDIVDQCDD